MTEACDASSQGRWCCDPMSNGEEGLTIAYASCTLSKAETNYAQIEEEGLAIVFGSKRYPQFLHGRQFRLVTEHKPLVTNLVPLPIQECHPLLLQDGLILSDTLGSLDNASESLSSLVL